MKWTKRLKRRLDLDKANYPAYMWKSGHRGEYERKGDAELYKHRGERSLKYYLKAQKELSDDAAESSARLEKIGGKDYNIERSLSESPNRPLRSGHHGLNSSN